MKKDVEFKDALKQCRHAFGRGVKVECLRWNSLLGTETRWRIADGYNTPYDNPDNDWTLGAGKTFEAALRRAIRKGMSEAGRRRLCS